MNIHRIQPPLHPIQFEIVIVFIISVQTTTEKKRCSCKWVCYRNILSTDNVIQWYDNMCVAPFNSFISSAFIRLRSRVVFYADPAANGFLSTV